MPLTRLPLTTGVSGTLAAGNGGTGVTSADEIGNLVLLNSQTASSSSSITFSSTYLTSTYKKYFLDYTDVTLSSDSSYTTFTVSYDNGSNYVSSGYRSLKIFNNDGSPNNDFSSNGQTNGTSVPMLGFHENLGNATDEQGSGRVTIFDPHSADAKLFITEAVMINSGGNTARQHAYASIITSSAINNIKIAPATGTIDTGVFTLYGVKT